MNDFAQIDRSLVAIFDIEEFSERTPGGMARLVRRFLELLSEHVGALSNLCPDSFSTGDGAIVSIGRGCHIGADSTGQFLRFVIALSSDLCQSGVVVRTAVNYSEGDRIVLGTTNALEGQYIQVGDAINVAARIVTFCEPREIAVSAAVHRLLRNHDLEGNFPLHHNEPFVTKHGLKLDTYTYVPPADLEDVLYSPTAPLHAYKRFASFPPLKPQTLDHFLRGGLDAELRKVVSNAYDAMSYINETKTFLSASEVIQVLTRPNYDPQDVVYVVSRNDRSTGFWTQKRRKQYIGFLTGNARQHGGNINQTRVLVYDQERSSDELMPEGDIYHDLEKLHAPKTLFNFPVSLLFPYERISELIFGFTLSTKHRYVILPVPGADIDVKRLRPADFGDLLQLYRDYDAADGPMKAIITADEGYVGSLTAEFENLLKDASAEVLK